MGCWHPGGPKSAGTSAAHIYQELSYAFPHPAPSCPPNAQPCYTGLVVFNRMVLPPAEPPSQKEGEMLRTNVLFKHIQVRDGLGQRGRRSQQAAWPNAATLGEGCARACAGSGRRLHQQLVHLEARQRRTELCTAGCSLAVNPRSAC